MPQANLTAQLLGLGGATADSFNRLSINTPAVLLNNAGAGIEATVNKAAPANDAAFAFKTGFSARALIGLLPEPVPRRSARPVRRAARRARTGSAYSSSKFLHDHQYRLRHRRSRNAIHGRFHRLADPACEARHPRRAALLAHKLSGVTLPHNVFPARARVCVRPVLRLCRIYF